MTLVASWGSRETLASANQVNISSGVGQSIGDVGAADILCGVCCLFVASLAERHPYSPSPMLPPPLISRDEVIAAFCRCCYQLRGMSIFKKSAPLGMSAVI